MESDSTTQPLSASAKKVQDALEKHGLDCKVKEMPASTRSAQDAANAIGCEVAQIVKSLVFRGRQSGEAILVETSGANRVNEKILAEAAGEAIEKADADFVRAQTGFAIGGIPPVAHAKALRTFIDQDLLQYEVIWAAAGTPNAVFPLTPAGLVKITGGRVIRVS